MLPMPVASTDPLPVLPGERSQVDDGPKRLSPLPTCDFLRESGSCPVRDSYPDSRFFMSLPSLSHSHSQRSACAHPSSTPATLPGNSGAGSRRSMAFPNCSLAPRPSGSAPLTWEELLGRR